MAHQTKPVVNKKRIQGTVWINESETMNQINPKKLLNSKWTAVQPRNKQKHFIVTQVKFNEEGEVILCVIEAVMSKNSESIDWQTLTNADDWKIGWK